MTDEDIKPEPITEEEKQEVLDELPEFDLNTLILEGKNSIIRRKVEFYDIKDQKKKLMPVYVKPLTKAEKSEIERAISKKDNNKNMNELLCSKGWVEPDGMPINLSKIREVPAGVVDSVADEIRFVSGEFKDRFEEAALEKLFGSG